MISWAILRPYNNKLRPADIMVFPWDAVDKPAADDKPKQMLSNEEIRARFEEAKRRYGLI